MTLALAKHATLLQVDGNGRANQQKMLTATKSLTVGMEWENNWKPVIVWQKVKKDHPVIINPAKAMMNENRKVNWSTYKNINASTDAAKEF